MLKTAAVLQFLLAAGHLLCLLCLDAVFRIYGIDVLMDRFAAVGAALPYVMTLGIACGLAGCGVYALSAAGVVRPLPLLRPMIYAIGCVFLLRALSGLAAMGMRGECPATEISAVLVSALIGALYLAGGIRTFKTLHA